MKAGSDMIIPPKISYVQGLVFRIIENFKKTLKYDSFGNLLKTMPTNFGSLHNV
jgi:hypothetical protein